MLNMSLFWHDHSDISKKNKNKKQKINSIETKIVT